MSAFCFSVHLEETVARMQRLFREDNTLVVRRAESAHGLHCAIFFFDGMVNSLLVNESIIAPIVTSPLSAASADMLARSVLQGNDCGVQPDSDRMFAAFLYGDTVVFTEGDARPVVVNTKGFSVRAASEPENERVLSGPHEGFTECFMPNLAMIRRRLNTHTLKFSFLRTGRIGGTTVCLCWLDGICPESIVSMLKDRISSLSCDSLPDSNALSERVRDHRFSLFPTLGTTERPDVVAARLLEGRCAMVSDGSPVVLTAPYLLQECFQSNDDYYLPFLQSGVARVLRYCAFFLTITAPGLFCAMLLYHRVLLPLQLNVTLAASLRGVPLPVGAEMLLLLAVLELLREAGARTPGAMGQTLSVVSGLVLGQAAVSAHFVSAPGVIVAAVAGMTGLLTPKLQPAALYLRAGVLLSALVFGLPGVFLAHGLILRALCRMHSLGLPYLLNLLPRVRSETEDALLRAPWFSMRTSRYPIRRRKNAK